MKKIIFIYFSFILCSSIQLIAQEKITKLDGSEMTVKIFEVNENEIRYKPIDNADGPIRIIDKNFVFSITYSNGQKEVITNKSQPAKSISSSESTNKDNTFLDSFKSQNASNPKKFSGPRIGFTYITPGTVFDYLDDRGKNNLITQMGWQFETRVFTVENGPSALIEFVPSVGGMEQGLFLPTASLLVGLRGAGKNPFEFAVGPNLSPDGTLGVVLALGINYGAENINFPINIVYLPSVGSKEAGTGKKIESGHKISILIGFNKRSK